MFTARIRTLTLTLAAMVGMTALVGGAAAQSDGSAISVFLRMGGDAAGVRAALEAVGAEAIVEHKHLDVIAAQMPAADLKKLSEATNAGAAIKSQTITLPDAVSTFVGRDGSMPVGSVQDVGTLGTLPTDNIPATFVRSIGDADEVEDFAEDNKNAYLLNHAASQVRKLHKDGHTGDGVIVAVIDTGLRPGFEHLRPGTVIGCEDILNPPVNPLPGPRIDPGCLDNANGGHGTFVAGLIAGNAIYRFDPSSLFLQAVKIHAPKAILGQGGDDDGSSKKSKKSGKSQKSGKAAPEPDTLAMIGSAPNAQIYAFRIFPTDLLQGQSSDILKAVDRIIELKQSGVDIDVVNMSFGRRTLFAGQDPIELAVDALLDHDILPVVAVGNSGPSGLTTASPASAVESLAVGAGTVAHQERIAADVFFGFAGLGSSLRPFDGEQTASFSSRGPIADGRIAPDVVTDGLGVFSQGLSEAAFDPQNDFVSLGNGTSFATPLTAGVAAVLRGAFPGATARQVRNAILESARPNVADDESGPADQGHGWVDARGAFKLLDKNKVSDMTDLPPAPSSFVADNIETATGETVVTGTVTDTAANLRPGERHEIFYQIPINTGQITIEITGVDAALPPAGQNPFFGDSLMVTLHSAKTSNIATGDYFDLNPSPDSVAAFIGDGGSRTFVIGDQDFDCSTSPIGGCSAVDNLEPGIVRITVGADPLNAGDISSANIRISSTTLARPGLTASGTITQGPLVFDPSTFQVIDLGNSAVVPVPIPASAGETEIRLEWDRDWSRYPANDIDVFVEIFGFIFFAGFTLDSPEVITIPAGFFPPFPVSINVVVSGFEVNSGTDDWRLRVTVDGVPVILP